MRIAEIERKTSETSIYVKWNLDGTGHGEIDTGIPFMDHMLTLFARHGGFDLAVRADGDLNVDCHHTMEDLGLTMGHALTQALGGKEGRHPPLREFPSADGRIPRAGRARPLRASVPGL